MAIKNILNNKIELLIYFLLENLFYPLELPDVHFLFEA